ncbi:MAG TPA: hypothetical protein VFT79_08780 [Solirubrobacterales bacterium]|nr:hypothetical protein [Solirubrobacterales bacterium]
MVEGLSEAQIVERLLRLEQQVRELRERAGLEPDEREAGVDPEVLALARAGDRMGAAKLHAERTGADFVEAQRIVNAL